MIIIFTRRARCPVNTDTKPKNSVLHSWGNIGVAEKFRASAPSACCVDKGAQVHKSSFNGAAVLFRFCNTKTSKWWYGDSNPDQQRNNVRHSLYKH